jgi:hypothetical protein
MTQEEKNVINIAQAELRAMYKRVGINGSNVLDLLDNLLEKQVEQRVVNPLETNEKEGEGGWNERYRIVEKYAVRLEAFVETLYKSLCTYGEHPIIDEQYKKLMKEGV